MNGHGRGSNVDNTAGVAGCSFPTQLLTWAEEVLPGHVSGARFIGVGVYRLSTPPDLALDLTVFRAAVDELVVRHDALRTVMEKTPDGYRQRELAPRPVPLWTVDLEDGDGDAVPAAIVGVIEAGEFRGGGLPLLWAVLGRHSPSMWTLGLVVHHSVIDHWSMELLMRDLAGVYTARLAGGDVAAPPRCADSVRAAVARFDRPRVERALRHWRPALADLPRLVAPDRDPDRAAAGFDADLRFDLALRQADLAAVSQAARTTAFVALLTAYALALREVADVAEVAVPVFTSGRERTDWETVGLFMNALVVRLRPDPGLPRAEALAATHRAFVEAYANEIPLALLRHELPRVSALFVGGDVPVAGFELIQFPAPPATVPGAPLAYRRLPVSPRHGATALPVSGLLCWLEAHGDDGFAGTVRYRSGLFDPAWVSGLATRFTHILQDLVRPGRDSVVTV
jgi:hypothetical protein